MIVNIPSETGITHLYAKDGSCFMAKVVDGRVVVDIPPDVFRSLLQGPQGLLWEKVNAGGDIFRFLAEGAHS